MQAARNKAKTAAPEDGSILAAEGGGGGSTASRLDDQMEPPTKEKKIFKLDRVISGLTAIQSKSTQEQNTEQLLKQLYLLQLTDFAQVAAS